jgi:hypothetical protein
MLQLFCRNDCISDYLIIRQNQPVLPEYRKAEKEAV